MERIFDFVPGGFGVSTPKTYDPKICEVAMQAIVDLLLVRFKGMKVSAEPRVPREDVLEREEIGRVARELAKGIATALDCALPPLIVTWRGYMPFLEWNA